MGEEHRQRSQRTRRGFTKEFKRDAVELVRSTGRPIAVVLGCGRLLLGGRQCSGARGWVDLPPEAGHLG